MSAVYRNQYIRVERVIDSWYAWTHLLHPATAARNRTDRRIAITLAELDCILHAKASRYIVGSRWFPKRFEATAMTNPIELDELQTLKVEPNR